MTGEPTLDDWTVLGLRPGASEAAVRTAYRDLAKRFHPDRNPGDARAAQRFQRINEAHAALRRQRRVRSGAPGEAPGQVPAPRALMALRDGDALWVHPAALQVAPDRTAQLDREAEGSTYPTQHNTVRVERRGGAHHVFMPPQPSVRWQMSVTPPNAGPSVAALWVGDRQQDRGDHAPRMPQRLLGPTVGELATGERGWAAAAALATDAEGRLTLAADEPLSADQHPATPLAVWRDQGGWWVEGEVSSEPLPSVEPETAGRIPLAGARLNGADVSVAAEPAPG